MFDIGERVWFKLDDGDIVHGEIVEILDEGLCMIDYERDDGYSDYHFRTQEELDYVRDCMLEVASWF